MIFDESILIIASELVLFELFLPISNVITVNQNITCQKCLKFINKYEIEKESTSVQLLVQLKRVKTKKKKTHRRYRGL